MQFSVLNLFPGKPTEDHCLLRQASAAGSSCLPTVSPLAWGQIQAHSRVASDIDWLSWDCWEGLVPTTVAHGLRGVSPCPHTVVQLPEDRVGSKQVKTAGVSAPAKGCSYGYQLPSASACPVRRPWESFQGERHRCVCQHGVCCCDGRARPWQHLPHRGCR